MTQWVVVECEWRRELLAKHDLEMQGFQTFWCHYMHVFTGHVGRFMTRPRPAEKRGLYQPWLFVRADGGRGPEDNVAAIRYTDNVVDVLWQPPPNTHYLEDWWLPWIVSNKERVNPMTGEIEKPPTCINPATGLFEPPSKPDNRPIRSWEIGARVKITGSNPFAGHLAAVERVDGEMVRVRTEQDILGRRVPVMVHACQLEPAS